MSAVSEIRDLLKQESFLGIQHNDVTHDDLKKINDILKGLPPEERNKVISELSEDELNTWTSEIDNGGGLLGTGLTEGLSADERRDLHNTLAKGLDGAQLERVYNSYDDRDQKLELAQSVATQGTSATKVDFVKNLAGDTTDKGNASTKGVLSITTTYGDTEARAVAEVLGSLGGDKTALNEAFTALNDDQLNAVFEAATQQTSNSTSLSRGSRPVYSYDVKPLTNILDAAATSDNAELKARAFEFAGRHLGTIAGEGTLSSQILVTNPGAKDQANSLRDSMAKLYQTDVNGITGALEQDYQAGKSMTNFLQVTLGKDGGKAEVSNYIAQLNLGNDGKGDAFQRFTDPVNQDGGVYYPNAEKLGYFAGSMHEAIEGIGGSRQENADLLKDVFGALTGQIPIPGVSDVAGFMTDKTVDTVTNQLKDGDIELFEALTDLTIPSDPRSSRVYDGPAENSYNEGWFSVTRQRIN